MKHFLIPTDLFSLPANNNRSYTSVPVFCRLVSHYLFSLCFLLAAGRFCLAQQTEEIWVTDGVSLRRIVEDPSRMHPNEWQIWLYKRGEKTGGVDKWGILRGRSVEDVKNQLDRSQKFEVRYCRFFNKPANCEWNMTYFNPFGPVAVNTSRIQSSLQRVMDLQSRMVDLYSRFKSLLDMKEALDKAMSPAFTSTHNPYAGIGQGVMGYGRDLQYGIQKLKELSERLALFSNNGTQSFSRDMARFDADLNASLNQVNSLRDEGEGLFRKMHEKDLPESAKTTGSTEDRNQSAIPRAAPSAYNFDFTDGATTKTDGPLRIERDTATCPNAPICYVVMNMSRQAMMVDCQPIATVILQGEKISAGPIRVDAAVVPGQQNDDVGNLWTIPINDDIRRFKCTAARIP